jgi:nicotinic acid mononucleotide adenylyltransferase
VGKLNYSTNLCNTKHSTKYSKGSVTRDIDYEDVVYVPTTYFRLYDTPGTASEEDTLECSQIIRASLTRLPINLIIINASLKSRYSETLKEFKEQIKIFKGY